MSANATNVQFSTEYDPVFGAKVTMSWNDGDICEKGWWLPSWWPECNAIDLLIDSPSGTKGNVHIWCCQGISNSLAIPYGIGPVVNGVISPPECCIDPGITHPGLNFYCNSGSIWNVLAPGDTIIWAIHNTARLNSPSSCPVISGQFKIPAKPTVWDCNQAAKDLQAPTLTTLNNILRLHFQWTPNIIPGATNTFLDISSFADFRDYLDTGGGAISGISLGPTTDQVDIGLDAAPIPLDLTSTFYARVTTRVPDGTFCISNIVPFTLSSLCDLAAKAPLSTFTIYYETDNEGIPIVPGGILQHFTWIPSQLSGAAVFLDISEFPDFREFEAGLSGIPIRLPDIGNLATSAFPGLNQTALPMLFGKNYYARVTTRITSVLFCSTPGIQFQLSDCELHGGGNIPFSNSAQELQVPLVDLSMDKTNADITFDWLAADVGEPRGKNYFLQIDKSPDFPRYQPFEPGVTMPVTQDHLVINTQFFGIFTLNGGQLDFDDYYVRILTGYENVDNWCLSNVVKFNVLRRLDFPAPPPSPRGAEYTWEALYRAIVCAGFEEQFPVGGDSPAVLMTAVSAAELTSFTLGTELVSQGGSFNGSCCYGPFQIYGPGGVWLNKVFRLSDGVILTGQQITDTPESDRVGPVTLACIANDLECAARVARVIYLRNGRSFSGQWDVWDAGSYRNYLPQARQTERFWSAVGGIDCTDNTLAMLLVGGSMVALIAYLTRRPVGRRI